jgi:hypothetical protein
MNNDALLKAAEQGNIKAQYEIAAMYYQGEGVPKDYAKAAEWYKKAAEHGYETAQHNLAGMYYKGDGVPKDFKKAAEWFEKAGKQGHVEAQYNLAVMYSRGEGMPKDYQKAAELYKKAAAQGHAEAQYQLACMYSNGKDYKKAAEWWTKATEQGNFKAQYELAGMCSRGEGADKSPGGKHAHPTAREDLQRLDSGAPVWCWRDALPIGPTPDCVGTPRSSFNARAYCIYLAVLGLQCPLHVVQSCSELPDAMVVGICGFRRRLGALLFLPAACDVAPSDVGAAVTHIIRSI